MPFDRERLDLRAIVRKGEVDTKFWEALETFRQRNWCTN